METTQEILNKLRDYKAAFAEKYGIERLGLFGSCAGGEQDDRLVISHISISGKTWRIYSETKSML